MKLRSLTLLAAVVMALAQDGEAPPAIAQWGITNWASHLPPELPAGAVARGSLIRIRGWRLGPAPLNSLSVVIRKNDVHAQAVPLSADENEIQALVPADAPLGSALIQVVKKGSASLEWPVNIVASSFGIVSRNGLGWGPGVIASGDTLNSETHAARPGETLTLTGTGLGVSPARTLAQVLVAGRVAKTLRASATDKPGFDRIAFVLPPDTVEGCHVPVQVSSAPGLYSNVVTLAVNRAGGTCNDPGGWLARSNQAVKLGTVTLLHADLLIGLTARQTAQFPLDAAFASFAAIDPDASANPLFLFPPSETCTSYSGTAGLRSITSPLSALDALPGVALDAGAELKVDGPGGVRLLPRDRATHRNYWAVIGGHSPAPGATPSPLYLSPGEYRVSAAGGPGLAPFQLTVRTAEPLLWKNRDQLAEVDRARGATVSWRPSAGNKSGSVLIIAMNVDSRSGATGACICLSRAASGSFRIPAYALANIPPTPPHPRGFPLNLMMVAELPESLLAPANAAGVDQLLAFAASISGRTVQFK